MPFRYNSEFKSKDQQSNDIGFHVKTLFLFTKSDFKTVFFPQTIFALAIAFARSRVTEHVTQEWPMDKIAIRLVGMVVWVWIHLLVADISNQRLPESILEDTINKPWRPLPAARITTTEAINMLRVIVMLSICISLLFGSYLPSITLMGMLWLYNDLDGNGSGPWVRNVLNAAGLTCYGWGAVTILLGTQIGENGKILRNWYILMALVITTTIHSQDFPDLVGDKARGRNTMPLLYGESLSRWSVAISVIFWSLVCPRFWVLSSFGVCFSTMIVGGTIATLVVLQLGQRYDKWVWRLWCLWLTGLYLLPAFSSIII
ncbi:UbiA prenyltransferase family-domain-containing protein [Annulohypoxylon maeteangense]|uniref:UbiA prenyltransferase family-domain-containing protein n=1 Tax=Annulohypoxylon maeteangense TaxID=1927788 RepID=UPI002007A663|nr:UbiA prenyltransferase family-domain-containing protein [Annulohypoxylon maeteangense]KAI0886975.1 UbiA prenyltransferase family-domain-containing protein [Annulohypoxylon maeteangense]